MAVQVGYDRMFVLVARKGMGFTFEEYSNLAGEDVHVRTRAQPECRFQSNYRLPELVNVRDKFIVMLVKQGYIRSVYRVYQMEEDEWLEIEFDWQDRKFQNVGLCAIGDYIYSYNLDSGHIDRFNVLNYIFQSKIAYLEQPDA